MVGEGEEGLQGVRELYSQKEYSKAVEVSHISTIIISDSVIQ